MKGFRRARRRKDEGRQGVVRRRWGCGDRFEKIERARGSLYAGQRRPGSVAESLLGKIELAVKRREEGRCGLERWGGVHYLDATDDRQLLKRCDASYLRAHAPLNAGTSGHHLLRTRAPRTTHRIASSARDRRNRHLRALSRNVSVRYSGQSEAG